MCEIKKKIAVLVTCYNRIEKSIICLESFYKYCGSNAQFDIYLVDDGSNDNTSNIIKERFPKVHIVMGTGKLYWAGGMRLAWKEAINSGVNYNAFLLINNDVEFLPSFWDRIEETDLYSKKGYKKSGVYVSSVKDKKTEMITYGGSVLKKQKMRIHYDLIKPDISIKECDLTHANILYVSKEAYEKVGILDSYYKHAYADFDYSLSAKKKNYPVLITPMYGGYCENDHKPINVLNFSFCKRIKYLYDFRGFSIIERLYFIAKHFWYKFPYQFIVLHLSVLFPNFRIFK